MTLPDAIVLAVTEAHVTKGSPNNCGRCPIALALIDAGYRYPSVSGAYVSLHDRPAQSDEHPGTLYALDTAGRAFVAFFDHLWPYDAEARLDQSREMFGFPVVVTLIARQ